MGREGIVVLMRVQLRGKPRTACWERGRSAWGRCDRLDYTHVEDAAEVAWYRRGRTGRYDGENDAGDENLEAHDCDVLVM